ncbi:Hypothetical protein, putative [Bodo saltans]|uniref:Uncharacterized protein n=1 Tax=Bodo saltans TaxID=75058 RepID=A0A0S4KJ59_BODSA|nr:Hypothetical protein, putative [Bodo saltans]|eukprot:CUI14616.1 Hypothetical protein, putative [Bodo saltans]
MAASNIIANLQGNELVLSSEITAISADIAVLEVMRARYSIQCGIPSLDLALAHLLQLRSTKEVLLAQVTSQLRSMEVHVASSAALVNRLSVGVVPSALSYVADPHFYYSDRTLSPVAAPSLILSGSPYRSTYVTSAIPTVIPAPNPSGVVQLHTAGGLVVTTNSSILANSPGRIR